MKKGVIAGFSTLIGAIAGASAVFSKGRSILRQERELDKKNDAILRMYKIWMDLRMEGKTVAEYLKENDVHSVAIYGMHYLGHTLLQELSGTEIDVRYLIDKNAEGVRKEISKKIEVFSPDQPLGDVDAVIVTAFFYFEEIEEMLYDKVDCQILSIEDILYEM